MKKRFKTLWVKALRSGKYNKGTGTLRRVPNDDDVEPVQHCCLGVLDEVVNSGAGCRRRTDFLSDYCLKKTGLKDELQYAFSGANDGGDKDEIKNRFIDAGYKTIPRLSFDKISYNWIAGHKAIAAWIEKNL